MFLDLRAFLIPMISTTDCASVAALAALLHFKRPDVTTNDHEIIVHSFDEKDAIPIVLHHYPVCVSYAFFNSG